MRDLCRDGFLRLSGKSETGAFYLAQSMGGGKTHLLIAFGLLVQNPSVRLRVAPDLDRIAEFTNPKVVVFNGHDNPENFIWGYVAEKLGRKEQFARFFQNGAQAPGTQDWVDLIGDTPLVLMFDELANYIQTAQALTVGSSDLAQVTVSALTRLFAALPRLPRTAIILTNLKDDIWAQGAAAVRQVIEVAHKETNKYSRRIDPVRQNTAELFQVIRAKLFDTLPSEEQIEEIGQAYVEALRKAKSLNAIASSPEAILQNIKECYPLHPSIRDIVATFKENSGYQQTRALIRILRQAVKSVWRSEESVFLIGLEHLDLQESWTIDEIRKINPSFTNAIARDITDRGNALAERIDANKGGTTAGAVAKIVLMSSLSTAENPVRGLRQNEIVEFLTTPFTSVSEIQASLEALAGGAWYLFKSPEERWYFGDTANVVAQIQETAAALSEEVVDKELREKLLVVFKPKGKACYHDVIFALPSLEELQTVEAHVRLVILEQPAHQLPEAFREWWERDERQNRILALTADSNAIQTLRAVARQHHAAKLIKAAIVTRHGKDSVQYREIESALEGMDFQFTSALRDTFKTLVFPLNPKRLREVADFDMEFANNNYDGEEQISAALSKAGKFLPADKFDANIEKLRLDAEDLLFPAKSVPVAELHRKAASQSRWYWLPPGGLDKLIESCVARRVWRQRDGVVEKGEFEEITEVKASTEDRDGDVFQIRVTAVNADTVHASETAIPTTDAAIVQGGQWKTRSPVVWFLAVDSKGKSKTGAPFEWRAPFHIEATLASRPTGTELMIDVVPRGAELLVTFDGRNPKDGETYSAPMTVPPASALIRIIAKAAGSWSPEKTVPVSKPWPRPDDPDPEPPTREPPEAEPVILTTRQKTTSTAETFRFIEALRSAGQVQVWGGKVQVQGQGPNDWTTVSFGEDVGMDADGFLDVVNEAKARCRNADVTIQVNRIAFQTGRQFISFADQAALDYETLDWEVGDGVTANEDSSEEVMA